MRCTCGHPEYYNVVINNGDCNICIAEKLELLEFAEELCPTTMRIAKKMLKEKQNKLGAKP